MESYSILLLTGYFLHYNFVKTFILKAFLYKQHHVKTGNKLSKGLATS